MKHVRTILAIQYQCSRKSCRSCSSFFLEYYRCEEEKKSRRNKLTETNEHRMHMSIIGIESIFVFIRSHEFSIYVDEQLFFIDVVTTFVVELLLDFVVVDYLSVIASFISIIVHAWIMFEFQKRKKYRRMSSVEARFDKKNKKKKKRFNYQKNHFFHMCVSHVNENGRSSLEVI
jgi:hypothetical protein